MVEFIHHGNSLHLYKAATLKIRRDFSHLFCLCKDFNGHGISKISDIKKHNGLFILDIPLLDF